MKKGPQIPELKDRDWLRLRLEHDKKSCSEIALNLGCSPTTVCVRAKRYGLRSIYRKGDYGRIPTARWLTDGS